MSRRPPKLQALLDTVGGRSPVLVLTHDNPDPDALASAAALRALLQQRAQVQCDIAYGGRIGRAENRALVDVLNLPVRPIEAVELARYPVLAIVDFQHTAGHHSLPSERVPDIVIDHHPVKRGSRAVPFYDYRRRVGATCTIVAQYLFAAEVDIDWRLATALTYGIKSETRDLARETEPIDIETYLRLYPLADKRRLAEIEMAPVGAGYFAVLAEALERARVYGDALVITALGAMPNGDMAAEMADIFLRLAGLRCAVVMGRFEGQLIVSVRTPSHTDDSGAIIERVFAHRGSAGGHGCMAAGQIPLDGQDEAAYTALEQDLTRGFRRAFKVTAGPGRKLVPRG